MDTVMEFLTTHTFIMVLLIFVIAAVVIYLLKSFVKTMVVSILVVLLIALGFQYYKSEGRFNDRMKSAVIGTKLQVEELINKGKKALSFGKAMFGKKQEQDERDQAGSGND
jgi:membrane protein implicated in regulation of membrane protease activity